MSKTPVKLTTHQEFALSVLRGLDDWAFMWQLEKLGCNPAAVSALKTRGLVEAAWGGDQMDREHEMGPRVWRVKPEHLNPRKDANEQTPSY